MGGMRVQPAEADVKAAQGGVPREEECVREFNPAWMWNFDSSGGKTFNFEALVTTIVGSDPKRMVTKTGLQQMYNVITAVNRNTGALIRQFNPGRGDGRGSGGGGEATPTPARARWCPTPAAAAAAAARAPTTARAGSAAAAAGTTDK